MLHVERKTAANKAFGKSGADGRSFSIISLINFSYGLTDPNTLAGYAKSAASFTLVVTSNFRSFNQQQRRADGILFPHLPKAGDVMRYARFAVLFSADKRILSFITLLIIHSNRQVFQLDNSFASFQFVTLF